METFGHVQVELRIKAMQPVLIPGPIGARCVTVDHLQLDQGSVVVWPRRFEHQQLIPDPNTTVYTACRNCGDIGSGTRKRQASSLTAGPGYDRMNLERNNYGQ